MRKSDFYLKFYTISYLFCLLSGKSWVSMMEVIFSWDVILYTLKSDVVGFIAVNIC